MVVLAGVCFEGKAKRDEGQQEVSLKNLRFCFIFNLRN